MAAWRQIWEDGTADTDLRLPPSGKGLSLGYRTQLTPS
jgi:hypothetical protein